MQVQRAATCPKCGRVFIEGERVCPFDATPFDPLATPSDAADPLIGAVVNRSYVVLAKLGEGGMGVVYRALQQRLDRQVALKVLGPRFGGDARAAERFRSEARAVSQLTNPHTVTVYDFGACDDGTLYLAMQLLKGESLRARMLGGRLSTLEALSITSDICDSLAEAHERSPQIIHRDIKPDNIFVRTAETGHFFATVLDFGLARVADSPSLTATNSVIGTVAYMAPEQARGSKELDGRADLYALGVMLFEMLVGHVPFDSPDKLAVMYKHVYDAPPRLRDVRPALSLPSSLEQLVADMLAKTPAQRPPTARAVRARITEIQYELGGFAPHVTPAAMTPLPGEVHGLRASSTPPELDFSSTADSEPTLVRRPPSAPPAELAAARASATRTTEPERQAGVTSAMLASAGLGPRSRKRAGLIAGAAIFAAVIGAVLLRAPATAEQPVAAPVSPTFQRASPGAAQLRAPSPLDASTASAAPVSPGKPAPALQPSAAPALRSPSGNPQADARAPQPDSQPPQPDSQPPLTPAAAPSGPPGSKAIASAPATQLARPAGPRTQSAPKHKLREDAKKPASLDDEMREYLHDDAQPQK